MALKIHFIEWLKTEGTANFKMNSEIPEQEKSQMRKLDHLILLPIYIYIQYEKVFVFFSANTKSKERCCWMQGG